MASYINIAFATVRTALFIIFLFIYKMFDSKTLKINIGATIKDPEMLRHVSDHLKTKAICKHAVKKLPPVINYVSDRYKTQRMCNKVVLENGEMLMFIPDF